MPSRRLPILIAVVTLALASLGARWEGSQDIGRMTEAAEAFLQALDDDQRVAATFGFHDDERTRFHFIPIEMFERQGVMLAEMDDAQRDRAHDLLQAGLSQRGYMTATQVMELEDVLLALEGGQRFARDRDEYLISIFGTPSAGQDWGWRFEGHHISLHFTVVGGDVAVVTPAFVGANPAEVQEGPQAGRRVLGDREDAGRALVQALNAAQRTETIIDVEAPRDILTGAEPVVGPLDRVGIEAGMLTNEQQGILFDLIDVYLSMMSDEIADHRRDRLLADDTDAIRFAWAGSTEPGEPHYYRVQGRTFLIEYDNTQNGANHIHSVWREFDGDFGRDLLREHRNQHPHD
ncbi:MAG: DUF3500 domain-containing protein [Longimicrobiales bacterium]|nr:DUF3500 domain-containing protein [Longimicrobiales bacterium]